MALHFLALVVILVQLFCSVLSDSVVLKSKTVTVRVDSQSQDVLLTLRNDNNDVILEGYVGLSLPKLKKGYIPEKCDDSDNCIQWGEMAKLSVVPEGDSCVQVNWISPLRRLKDCYNMSGAQWYGGAETFTQYWPIDGHTRKTSPYITTDFLSTPDLYGGVIDPYWFSSKGAAVYVHGNMPLFVGIHDNNNDQLCLSTEYTSPYKTLNGDQLPLNYTICKGTNAKDVHMYMVNNYIGKPKGIPDEIMFKYPIWSTWAKYKKDINQSAVMDYSQQILKHNFKSSQVEIDDNWESCYGEHEFDVKKFPNVTELVDLLHKQGQRVTAWIHPFVNYGCPSYEMGLNESYFVTGSERNISGISRWWDGKFAGQIDFTNADAVKWWISRLKDLQESSGLDSFKFDAGEAFWLPVCSNLNADLSKAPNVHATAYAEAVSVFGGSIEVRVGYRAQHLPILVRMMDKNSNWGYENGLKTMITTLLHFNIIGYPFVLPDMIGGNAYEGYPDRELYIRWLQANVFMPTLQFSIAPWDYDDEVVKISHAMINLHVQYSDYIIQLAHEAVEKGTPINRPVWWLDPNDEVALKLDSEFLLGDKVLVAPILEKGATSRSIYLPKGEWLDQLRNKSYTGPVWLKDYPVALHELAYFLKTDRHNYRLHFDGSVNDI